MRQPYPHEGDEEERAVEPRVARREVEAGGRRARRRHEHEGGVAVPAFPRRVPYAHPEGDGDETDGQYAESVRSASERNGERGEDDERAAAEPQPGGEPGEVGRAEGDA